MGYLDTIINPELNPAILHRRMLEENKKFQNEELKNKLINDPTYSDKILSHLSRSAMTDKAAAKLPEGANFDRALLAIDKDDPRRAVLAKMQKDMPDIIRSSPYGEDPSATIMNAVIDRGKTARDDTYKFIRDRGFFDKEVAPVANPEDYAEWERKNPGITPLSTSLAMGAGSQLAAEGLKSQAVGAIPKVGRLLQGAGRLLSFIPTTPTPMGLGKKLIAGGLMTAGGMLATDVIKQNLVKSGAIELSANPLTRLAQELAIGAPGFMGVGKLGGMGVAKGSSMINDVTKGMEGLLEGPTGLKRTGGLNEFDVLASPGMRTVMKDGVPVEEAIPGRLVGRNAIGREELKAADDAMNLKKELDAANALKEESFKKLNDDDLRAIQLDPTKENDIRNAAFARNKAAYIQAQKDLADKTRIEIDDAATYLIKQDPTLGVEAALEKARRIIAPRADETLADNTFLKDKFGWTDDQLSSMTARQRAEHAAAWEKFASPEGRQLTVWKAPDFAPPAVKQSTPWKLPENMFEAKPAGLTNLTNEATIFRLKETARKRDLLKPGLTPITNAAGNDKNIARGNAITIAKDKAAAAQEAQNRRLAFDNEATKLMSKAKADIEVATKDVPLRVANDKLNEITVKLNTEMDNLVSNMGYNPEAHARMLSKFNQEMKAPFMENAVKTEELDELAAENMQNFVKTLSPSSNTVKLSEIAPQYTKAQKAKEFNDIIGHTGKISQEELNAKGDAIAAWDKKWNTPKKFIIPGIAAASLIPLSGILSPNEAQAGMIDRAITSEAYKLIQSSGNPIDQMAAKLIEAGHGSPVRSADGQSIVSLMRGQSYAPTDVSIFPKTRVMNIVDKILDPHTRAEVHFNARGNNGERLPFSPAVEVADRGQVIAANTEATLNTVRDILKAHDIPDNLQEISELTKPLVDKYHKDVNLHAPYYEARIGMLDDVLSGNYRSHADTKAMGLSKQIKLVGKDVSKLDPEDKAFYDTLVAEKQKAQDALINIKPTVEAFNAEHEVLMKELASKYPTARVSLAVDGTGMDDANPWLRNMLTSSEKQAADKITAINQMYAVRMKETGHDILPGAYMHHPAHPTVDYTDDLKELDKISPDGANAMRLVNFFHRSQGSKLMIPDTSYIMAKYVPDANKRIEMSDFWKMGKEGGWDAVRKQMEARGGYDGALKLLDDVRTAFDPADLTTSGKWLNRYAAFEVARLLTLSPSVSFKHALKLMGNWTIFPGATSVQAASGNVGLVARQFAQAAAGDTFKGKDFVADLGKAYTNQSHIYAAISDMAPYELPLNQFDKYLSKWNELGSLAVRGVENFDRGQTFASAMLMAQKKGMTPEQARYALMDSVLKVNFLTGQNNPKWLKDPLIRTMMLFQGTPFKILEQRAMLSYQAGRDIGNTLKLLGKLREDVKQGEANFKWHLLKDELTKSKDIYGTPYTSQFLKQLMVIGSVIGTGKMAFDSDMWGHVVHIPGVQAGDKGLQLGVNPAVSAVYKTVTGKNITAGNEDEFWMSRFLNSWVGGAGFPAIARKMARLSEDDIPAMYKDNKLNYLFGVPKTKEK